MTGIDHIGIAVHSLEQALPFWRDVLGLEFRGFEEVASEGVRVAVLQAGGARIELLEPLREDSPIARHLERRGEGVHHIALEVQDLAGKMADLAKAGRPALDERPRPGAEGKQVTFLHPRQTGGVLVELTQPGCQA